MPSIQLIQGLVILRKDLQSKPLKCFVKDIQRISNANLISQMVENCVLFFRSTQKREVLITKGKKRVCLFSWEMAARKTMEVYEQKV